MQRAQDVEVPPSLSLELPNTSSSMTKEGLVSLTEKCKASLAECVPKFQYHTEQLDHLVNAAQLIVNEETNKQNPKSL